MELHLRITWKLFCCSLVEFKKRIATLVDGIKELHHVYIANLHQCNSTHSADASVHLFIEPEPNKVDEALTRKLHGKMEEILKGNDTSEAGKYFKDLVSNVLNLLFYVIMVSLNPNPSNSPFSLHNF